MLKKKDELNTYLISKKVLETGISRVFVKRLFFKFIISSKGESDLVFKADFRDFMDIEQTSVLLPPVFSSANRYCVWYFAWAFCSRHCCGDEAVR